MPVLVSKNKIKSNSNTPINKLLKKKAFLLIKNNKNNYFMADGLAEMFAKYLVFFM